MTDKHGSPFASPPLSLLETDGGDAPLVALVGPPNAGKSTLFNRLTGLRQKVANYPGVTVERRLGQAQLETGGVVDIVDLPGIYGFSAGGIDERIARDAIQGTLPGLRRPDAVVLVLDATQLARHLVLASSVLEISSIPTIVLLNMADELERGGGQVDTGSLEDRLGVPVALVSAKKGDGLEMLGVFLECVAAGRGVEIPGSRAPTTRTSRQLPVIQSPPERRAWAHSVGDEAGYRAPTSPPWTRRLDALLLHRVAGPLVFLAVVLIVFQSIFTVAQPLMDGVEAAIAMSGSWIASVLPDTWFRELLIDGVWLGVGSVIVFLPQILILFLFIGILEDSGYMARAALMADRFMRRVGLQGKSFLPLMASYACAVPAILAARTIENDRDRLATVFVAPFMTCSARLPVYALLIAAFIPERPLFGPIGTRAGTLLGLYALGLVAAIGTAWLLKSSILKGKSSEFAMELPPYRLPGIRSLVVRLLDRSKIFLRRAGTIILTTAIVLWALTRFPVGPDGGPPPLDDSALGQIGQLAEPVVEPLGFDWKIAVGIVSSLAAREVIVGTLGTLYGVEDPTEESLQLQSALQQDLTFGGAIALLIFFVFALQCMSTVAVMKRETGGWKWPLIQWGYMLVMAYVGALVAFKVF